MYGDIKFDNFITDCNKKIFLVDCMNYNGSVEQALNYDLMSAIYCLSYKCYASLVLSLPQQFFSSAEICDALKFLYLTSARLDSIFEKERTNEFILENS